MFGFVRRAAGVSPEEFHERWRTEHAEPLAANPALAALVKRYELNHRLAEDYERDRHALEVADAGYDGVAVQWFDSVDAFQAFVDHPDRIAMQDDLMSSFLSPDVAMVLTREPDVIVDKPGARATAGAKMLCILRRHPALDLGTFHEHWLRHHGGLFQRIPELNEPLLGYDQNHGLDLPDAAYDGVTEQWFASMGAFVESLGAAAHADVVEPDVAYLLDPSSIRFVMAGKPTVVIDG